MTPPPHDRRETENNALCRFDGSGPHPDSFSLAAIEGDTLYVIDGRGRSHSIYTFGLRLGFAMASPTHSVVTARGEFFAAAVAWVERPVTRASRVTVELVTFRRDATFIATSRYTLPYDASGNELRIAGNECGVFVFGWTFGSRRQMAWLAPGGIVGPIEGRIPLADPDDTATLATQVRASPTGGERVEWFDLEARSFVPHDMSRSRSDRAFERSAPTSSIRRRGSTARSRSSARTASSSAPRPTFSAVFQPLRSSRRRRTGGC